MNQSAGNTIVHHLVTDQETAAILRVLFDETDAGHYIYQILKMHSKALESEINEIDKTRLIETTSQIIQAITAFERLHLANMK